jgi:hypothetical protein
MKGGNIEETERIKSTAKLSDVIIAFGHFLAVKNI